MGAALGTLYRNFLHIGLHYLGKHPRRWSDEEWEDAREFIALRLLETEENAPK